MMRTGRSALSIGLALVGLALAVACSPSSTPLDGATGGTGGVAGTTGVAGVAGTTGDAGTSGLGGMSGKGGDTAGTGGSTACNAGIGGNVGRTLCGPVPTCEGNSVASLAYCDQAACSGPTLVWQRTPCGDMTCSGGKCLTNAVAPAKTCSIATDCGLPPTVCIGNTRQMIFSDPSCDDGQCHWKQIVDTCGTYSGTTFLCTAGTCYDPGMLTRGPVTPTPSPDPMQPPPAPAHACGAATDCPQPTPTCFYDSVVSYVHGTCRAGMCSWEIDLNECGGTCGDGGVCVGP
jgi:hypothetical protein